MAFNDSVKLKYQLYNSLFLTLPFEGVSNTGMYLPLLEEHCKNGLKLKNDPKAIINSFFVEHLSKLSPKEQIAQLYRFVQYIERQVVLFDATEDASFEKLNDLSGKGTVAGVAAKIGSPETEKIIKEKLEDFAVRIVLTAHPTQFYHGHILSIITDMEEAIRNDRVTEINKLLKQLGLTKFYHREKPTPYDEAISLIWYLENVFYNAIPSVINEVKQSFNLDEIPYNLIKMGFWPGGDRDGNPFVTPEITKAVSKGLKDAVLRAYQKDLRKLKRRLTFSDTDKLARKIERKISAQLYDLAEDRYANADELLVDLQQIKELLMANYNSLFVDEVEQLISKVKTFGFYFATLDIRQDSRVHHSIVCEILEQKDKLKAYESLKTETDKMEFLWNFPHEISENDFAPGITKDTIGCIKLLGSIQQENGEAGCNRYIISNTQSMINLFELLFLFKVCGYKLEQLPFDIIPLFETVDDLQAAPAIMDTLYKHPLYKQYLANRKGVQTIMLGFSDGTKDGGYLTANWAIYQAKKELSQVSRSNNIKVLFFDGRGGPPARGGGDTHAFYASQGASIENKEIQITIQGQTISSKFGSEKSAKYNIEQLLTAGLNNALEKDNSRDFTQEEETIFNLISEFSFKSYSNLKDHPQFLEYLEEVTVLNFYSETNIGSRPAKRKGGKLSLDSLRAIPFVGAWSQMKQNVPGFYGLGSALKQTAEKLGEEKLTELYNNSLFFRALIQNSMQSLAKTNFELTRYLNEDPKFGAFWNILREEYELTLNWLLKLANYSQLLEESPNNRRSIKLRESMVLPLLIIQQYALIQLKSAPENEKEIWKKLIVRCFFGNINATRNAA